MKKFNIEKIKEIKMKDDLRREQNKTVGGDCLKYSIYKRFILK